MPKLPKLKVKTIPGFPDWEVHDFEQAKDFPFTNDSIFVEGYKVNSYEELVQLAARESYRDHEFLEVMILYRGVVEGG